MANRIPGAAPPATLDGLVRGLLRRIQGAERAVRDLQGQRGQSLPADYRFEVRSGKLWARKVSTGESWQVEP